MAAKLISKKKARWWW